MQNKHFGTHYARIMDKLDRFGTPSSPGSGAWQAYLNPHGLLNDGTESRIS